MTAGPVVAAAKRNRPDGQMLRRLPDFFRGLAHFAAREHRMPTGVDAMLNRFTQLRRKEVINLCDGCRLGCVGDVEVKLPEG